MDVKQIWERRLVKIEKNKEIEIEDTSKGKSKIESNRRKKTLDYEGGMKNN